jgi:uncharacterized protein
MATKTIALRDLMLKPGQSHQQDFLILPDPYRQGGIEYGPVGGEVEVRVNADRMHQGWATRLRLQALLAGSCQRCLEPAQVNIDVDTREVHDPESGDAELMSDFIDRDEVLDVAAWAQDAIGVAFPWQVVCREDCKGLCPTCGVNRNTTECSCAEEQTDSRWDALKDLKLDEPSSGD